MAKGGGGGVGRIVALMLLGSRSLVDDVVVVVAASKQASKQQPVDVDRLQPAVTFCDAPVLTRAAWAHGHDDGVCTQSVWLVVCVCMCVSVHVADGRQAGWLADDDYDDQLFRLQ